MSHSLVLKLTHFQVDAAHADGYKFSQIVELASFDPFKNTEAALENCNSISEGNKDR